MTISEFLRKDIFEFSKNIISSTTEKIEFYWDKSIGVLVEAQSSFPNVTLTTIIMAKSNTNI